MGRAQLRIQTPAFLLSSQRAEIFQPGATETRHGQGSDAQQQGKEETEGRQEHQEGRGRALAVRVRQGGNGPSLHRQEGLSGAALTRFTSPRLRGEVGSPRRCEASCAAIRVRGTLRALFIFRICGYSPSPRPSPRKERGEGETGPRALR